MFIFLMNTSLKIFGLIRTMGALKSFKLALKMRHQSVAKYIIVKDLQLDAKEDLKKKKDSSDFCHFDQPEYLELELTYKLI